jgi:hypothetical protein
MFINFHCMSFQKLMQSEQRIDSIEKLIIPWNFARVYDEWIPCKLIAMFGVY